jgi:hypothetical protein
MFAARSLLCAAALCVWSVAASAQVSAPPPAGTSPAEMNRVTPSPSISGPTPNAAPDSDRRPGSEQSPLLNPDTSWTPRSPRLPNASPDEPSLNAPLLPRDQ